MKRHLLVAAIVVFTIVLTGQRSRPAETLAAGHGEIEGSVVTYRASSPEPLQGWRVLLGTNECKLVSTATTDAKGNYRFANLEPGAYVVEIANDQPHGQGWDVLQPRSGGSCDSGQADISVSSGRKATAETVVVQLFDDPRGYFGSVFGDANENGKRDPNEAPFLAIMRSYDLDMISQFTTDLEGNFRDIESATPIPGNPVKPPLSLRTCPAHPVDGEGPSGYRLTTPVPNADGRYGSVTKVSDQVFRCEDFGLYLVDPNPAEFIGEVWLNADPVVPGTKVTAWIGDTDCGEGYVYETARTSRYEVIVRSANTRAGCGTEGAELRFTLNGESTPAVGQWHVRTWQNVQQVLDIVAGPPFARYDVEIVSEGPRERSVKAYVGDTLCAEAMASTPILIMSAPSALGAPPYPETTLIVPPDSLKAGCGREGATVRFVVDGVTFSPTQSWAPGTHEVQLTVAPVVSLPNTGSGGLLPH